MSGLISVIGWKEAGCFPERYAIIQLKFTGSEGLLTRKEIIIHLITGLTG